MANVGKMLAAEDQRGPPFEKTDFLEAGVCVLKFQLRRKKMDIKTKTIRMFGLVVVMTLMAPLANADYSTGFESSEGFTADSTLDGVGGWAHYSGNAARGKAWDGAVPGPKAGSQYARVYGGTWAGAATGFNRQLDVSERIGSGRANVWTTNASVWMAAASNDSSLNFGGVYFSDADGKDAAVAGFKGDKFSYFHGTTSVSSSYTFSANAWYLFEFTIKCNGTGVIDTYDMKVSNTSGTEVFSVIDRQFRANGEVDYIDNIKIFSGRAISNASGWDILGSTYFDQIRIPEPATLCLLALGGIGMLVRRRRS